MTVRRNKTTKSKVVKKPPVTKRKARNIPEFVNQRIETYKDQIITFSELNQSNDKQREMAVADFLKAILGDTSTKRRSRYADVIDSIPILGDIAQLFVIARTELEYQKYQIADFLVGLVPIIGDIADYLFTPDTNSKIAEMRLRQEYYNSLVATGNIREANAYMQQVRSEGHKLRPPKQKELQIILGNADGHFKKLADWENEKLDRVAETWSKWGVFGWRKLTKTPRIGANDRVQISPDKIGGGLDKVQKTANAVSEVQKMDKEK